MDSFGYQYGFPQHHTFAESERHNNESWISNPLVSDISVNRMSALHSQLEPWTMGRYLHEPQQRPSFHVRHVNEERFAIPIHSEPLYSDAMQYAYPNVQRMSSPSLSGPSSHTGSSLSDRYNSPHSSPGPSGAGYSPQMAFADISYGGHHVLEAHDHHLTGHCKGVSLHDVQGYADAAPDRDSSEDDHPIYYGYQTQEVYHHMEDAHPNGDLPPSIASSGADTSSTGGHSPQSPNIRRRKPAATRSVASPTQSAKVGKRPSSHKRSAPYKSKADEIDYSANDSNSNKAFPCPFVVYGCMSTFGSKNEWKRHVNTQHMRLGYWRCDQCDQAERKPNDFNRKDLFIQHVRRMHPTNKTPKPTKSTKNTSPKVAKQDPDEQELAAAAHRCFNRLRNPPEHTCCLFCDYPFNGAGTWDERLEHIGRHMESRKKENKDPVDPKQWQTDASLEEWLAEEAIIKESGKGWILVDGQA